MILDDALRPWLLEVNASPSMSAENAADRAMKAGLLDDTLEVVDMERRHSRVRPGMLDACLGGCWVIGDWCLCVLEILASHARTHTHTHTIRCGCGWGATI